MTETLPFDVQYPSHRVTDETTAILRLLDGDPIHRDDKARIVSAIVYAAVHGGGYVDSNLVRSRLTNEHGLTVYPRLIGSTYHSLAALGVLEPAGWITNEDTRGRNAGRPARRWRMVRKAAAA